MYSLSGYGQLSHGGAWCCLGFCLSAEKRFGGGLGLMSSDLSLVAIDVDYFALSNLLARVS